MGTRRVLDCGSGTPDYHPRGHTGSFETPRTDPATRLERATLFLYYSFSQLA